MALLLSTLDFPLKTVLAQGTAFTYEGRLTFLSSNASGTHHFLFDLFDAATNGNVLAENLRPNISVSNGLFTASLDFGNNFNGQPRWLQIGVQAEGDSGYTTLIPRQPLTAAPWALFASRAGGVTNGAITSAMLAVGAVTSSNIVPGSIGAPQLAPGAAAANLASVGLSAMPRSAVVMSAQEVNPNFLNAGFVASGDQISVSDDHWDSLPAGPPASGSLNIGRYGHKSVWTGSEVIIIGGTPVSDGLRYNPSANSWAVMNKTNAPGIGENVQAGWTGSRLLVWDAHHRIGGRYNPITDAWQSMSDSNAPSARDDEVSVFVNGYFVIWGGTDADTGAYLNTGARYNPTNNTWTAMPTSGAPSRREGLTATAIGSDAIFFGGYTNGPAFDTDPPSLRHNGARYNPAANSWSPIADAPEDRALHVAAWSGTYLYIWGGIDDYGLCTDYFGFTYNCPSYARHGLRYNPASDAWNELPTNNQPCAVRGHTAVWNGSNFIVWGGQCQQGGSLTVTSGGARYSPGSGTWTTLPNPSGAGRSSHSAVWTGTQMIVWGGADDALAELDDGFRYNSSANSWSSMSTPPATGEPSQRHGATAIWTGSRMIVWGGVYADTPLRSGGIYRPGTGTWTSTPTTGAPSARELHTAVWTGKEMIIWGGSDSAGNALNTGGRFNVSSNRWFPASKINAPRARKFHSAVWTGKEMLVWGGYDYTNSSLPTFLTSGGSYNPSNDTWTTIPDFYLTVQGIPGRAGQTAIWTGTEMLIWGGFNDETIFFPEFFNDGYAYNPTNKFWRTLPDSGLSARFDHTAIWTGDEMLIWGGGTFSTTNTGARYRPSSDSWTLMTTNDAPPGFSGHVAVWADYRMIVWPGMKSEFYYLDGGIYDPLADKWTSITDNSPGPRAHACAVWTGTQMLMMNGEYDGDELGENSGDNMAFTPRKTLYLYQKP